MAPNTWSALGEYGEGGVLRWSEVKAMAQHAEAVGFDSLWLADHLIVNLGEALGVPGHPDRTLNEAASDPDSRHSDWSDIPCARSQRYARHQQAQTAFGRGGRTLEAPRAANSQRCLNPGSQILGIGPAKLG